MLDRKRETEFDLYLQAGQRLLEQGDLSQAEKILKSGLRKLDEHIIEQNQLRSYFLKSLEVLKSSAACIQDSASDSISSKREY